MGKKLCIEYCGGFVMMIERVEFLLDHGIEPFSIFPYGDNGWRILYEI